MIYLTGVTNDRDEPAILAAGIGLMIQPGNGYHLRVDRYPYWSADNGCFNPDTYVGDEAWLDWVDCLPRDGCLFVVVPDVARRPDGSLGGDPAATWERFAQLGPIVQAMGFPAALAAQDGMERMPNLQEQLEACDVVFVAGSDRWKVGPAAAAVVARARALGKWCHMGRVNGRKRFAQARAMGCNSADGTFLKWRKRKRTGEADHLVDTRGVGEVGRWITYIDTNPLLPGFADFETPSLPVHRRAATGAEAP